MEKFADLRDQLRSMCIESVGEKLATSYVAMSRPALGLRKVYAATRSHFGGEPALSPDTPWPLLDGSPMASVATLDLAEVGTFEHGLELPVDGFLNVFICFERRVELGEVDAAEIALFVYCRSADAELRAVPDGVKRFPWIGLEAMQLLSLPSYEDRAAGQMMSPAEEDELEAAGEIRFDQRGTCHQLGGWPTLLQEPLRWTVEGGPPRFVLQLDYDPDLDFRWIGDGILYFAVRNLGQVSTFDLRASCCLQL